MRLAPHPFTLRQLQYALAVAEHRSFRRAAELCGVSQPSLSAQIAELEGALGLRLFERDRRRVLVAPAAEALLERARTLAVGADDLLEAARQLGDPLAGTMRLGVIPTISPYLLPEIAPVLRRAFPKLTLVWREDKTANLTAELEAGGLDGALLALEAPLPQLEHAVIGRDPFVLAAPPGHPLSKKTGAATLRELEGERVLLLDDGHCFRDQALAFCARADTEEIGYRATSLATLAQMVAGGAGVTLLPSLAVAVENRSRQLGIRPFSAPAPGRTIALVWRRGSPLGGALRQLATVAREPYERLSARAAGTTRR